MAFTPGTLTCDQCKKKIPPFEIKVIPKTETKKEKKIKVPFRRCKASFFEKVKFMDLCRGCSEEYEDVVNKWFKG